MPRKVLITKDTLEEILAKYQGGGSGGGGSGSGTSDVLYKHIITGLVAEPDTPETDPEQVTLTFLSKHANSFASNSSLVDFGTNILHTADANVFISPMIVGNSGAINVTVYPIVANGSLSQIHIFFPYSTNGNFYYQITASRNSSGLTDTVTPYIQVSGGSGSSAESRYRAAINLEVDNVSQFGLIFDFFEWDLDNSIDELNAGLSQMGVSTTVTKENWSTVVPALLNQMIQLGQTGQAALTDSLGLLLQNCYKCISSTMDGYTTDINILSGSGLAISGTSILFGTNTVSFTSSTLVKISQ